MAKRTRANFKSTKDAVITTNGVGGITGAIHNDILEDVADSMVFIDDVLDEDDMSSDSAVYPPSQQSVKAYVDSRSLTLSAHITLTQAQIQSLNTTPIEVIPTQGADTYIQVIGASAQYTHNGTSYTSASTLNLKFESGNRVWNITTFIDAPGGTIESFEYINGVSKSENRAIQVDADVDATGNGGTIDVYVQYVVIDTN